MKLLLQRVQQACVTVDGHSVGSIDHGILALVGIEAEDTFDTISKALHKLMHYRIFSDKQGKMNLNLQQVQGELLLVSQFTLVADTQKGLRPSFSKGAHPEQGKILFSELVNQAKSNYTDLKIATGQYGADMKVSLINDGPVTFMINVQP
jgi:D-tyrosyl-tRNA(Tyr) deacylase